MQLEKNSIVRSHVPFTFTLPMVTFQTKAQHQNRDIDGDVVKTQNISILDSTSCPFIATSTSLTSPSAFYSPPPCL